MTRRMLRWLAVLAFVSAASLPEFAFQAPSQVNLTSSENPGVATQPLTLTATVPYTPPAAVPTGTVTFLDGGTAVYSPVKLNATGAAVFVTSSLAPGNHTITAMYSGDANYAASTSSALAEVIAPAPASDYTFASEETTATAIEGEDATYALTVTPINGYNGTVTFSCSALPTGSNCAFTPVSLTPNNDSTELTASLSVSTTSTTTCSTTVAAAPLQHPRAGHQKLLLRLSGIGIVGLVLLGSNVRGKPKQLRIAGLLCLITLIVSVWGCGGSSSSSTTTPIGTYPFTVDAVGTPGTNGGNTSTHEVNLTLMVTTCPSS